MNVSSATTPERPLRSLSMGWRTNALIPLFSKDWHISLHFDENDPSKFDSVSMYKGSHATHTSEWSFHRDLTSEPGERTFAAILDAKQGAILDAMQELTAKPSDDGYGYANDKFRITTTDSWGQGPQYTGWMSKRDDPGDKLAKLLHGLGSDMEQHLKRWEYDH